MIYLYVGLEVNGTSHEILAITHARLKMQARAIDFRFMGEIGDATVCAPVELLIFTWACPVCGHFWQALVGLVVR